MAGNSTLKGLGLFSWNYTLYSPQNLLEPSNTTNFRFFFNFLWEIRVRVTALPIDGWIGSGDGGKWEWHVLVKWQSVWVYGDRKLWSQWQSRAGQSCGSHRPAKWDDRAYQSSEFRASMSNTLVTDVRVETGSTRELTPFLQDPFKVQPLIASGSLA